MTMQIKALPIRGGDLKPGDLFSNAGPDYWKTAADHNGIGEKVYIRTNIDASQSTDDINTIVYLITIEPETAEVVI